jgi:hypothetical protein
MHRWIRGRLTLPSPAMVVAIAALVAAIGGTAVAATATIVNIADPTTPAHKAKVDATGALKTAGTSTVSGFVGQAIPQKPFFSGADVPSGMTTLMAANKATVALTRMSVENYFAQIDGAHVRVTLFQQGGDASTCDGSTGVRMVGAYDVAPGQTYSDAMESPIVLKPLGTGDVWCLTASVDIEGGTSSGYYLPEVAWSGYVASGTLPPGALATTNARPGAPPQVAR